MIIHMVGVVVVLSRQSCVLLGVSSLPVSGGR